MILLMDIPLKIILDTLNLSILISMLIFLFFKGILNKFIYLVKFKKNQFLVMKFLILK